MITAKATVREYQLRLSELAGKHQRAIARLEATKARREKILDIQNKLVDMAEHEVNQAVVGMALGVGPDLTANILGRDLNEIRRILKSDS